MNVLKILSRILYKGYLIIRERFFHIPPPETHPPQPSSIVEEGMGEDDIQREHQLVKKQQFQPSQVSTSRGGEVVEEEKTVTVPPPPLTPPTRGGGTCPPVNGETFPPPVPLSEGDREVVPLAEGDRGRSGGGAELLQRTSDFEAPPLLEGQHISLCETLDRVLNTGVVVHGHITISVANIDLIYIGLRALLTSVETARQSGINHMTDF